MNYSGTTGVKSANLSNVKNLINKIKKYSRIPVCSGFGIKTPEDAKEISSINVEGVIVGSTFVDYIENNLNEKEMPKNIGKIVKTFTKGLS